MFDLTHHSSWDEFFTDEIIEILSSIYLKLSNGFDFEDYCLKEGVVPQSLKIYPCKSDVLRFIRTNLNNVKCVIVGMDPYPSWNSKYGLPQATGRAFEVSELDGKGWDYPIKQASLRNILRSLYYNKTGNAKSITEIRQEILLGSFSISNPCDWFDKTEEQGVLWLNSTLTVEAGNPGSHEAIWEPFRKRLFPFLADRDIPFMLWGNNAVKEVGSIIPMANAVLSDKAPVVTKIQLIAPHPRVEAFIKNNTFKSNVNVNWYC